MPQCSQPPHWPRYQRRLGNYDWLPASYTSGQPSCSRWHPTCGASSQWSHTVSSTPCHGAWTSAPLSAHLSTECECTAPQIGTPICSLPVQNNSPVHLTSAAQWTDYQWNAEWLDNTTRLRTFIPDTGTHPFPGMTLPRKAWVRLNRLRTGVGRFRSCLYKWGMAPSAACECGAEEQTAGRVVLQCPIHRPLHRLHGLAVQDVETTQWMLNTCPEIQCGLAADCQNSLKRWRRNAFDADRTKIVQIVWIISKVFFSKM